MKNMYSLLSAMVLIMIFSTSALGGGTAHTVSPSTTSPAPSMSSDQVYTVQVASFRELWRARNLAAYLDINGHDSAIMLMKGRGGVEWYVVRSGEYKGYRTAKKTAWAIEDFMREGTLVRRLSRAYLAERNVPAGIQLATTFEIKRTVTSVAGMKTVRTTAEARPEPTVKHVAEPASAVKAAAIRKPASKPAPSYSIAKKPYPDAPAAVTVIDHKTHRKLADKGLSVTLRRTDAGRAVQDPARTARAYPPAKSKQEPLVRRVYTVQTASFNRPDRARRMVETLKEQGFDAYAISMFGWHVVHSGEFGSYADATKRQADLKRVLKDATIIRDLNPEFVSKHKERFLLASTQAGKKAVKAISKPKKRPVRTKSISEKRELKQKMVTVAKFADPGEAGKTARAYRNQGIPSTVVYMGGAQPWFVVQNGGEQISYTEALSAIQASR